MKKVLSFYYIPVILLALLSFLNLREVTAYNVLMALVAAILLGLLAGFVFHMTMLIKKKVSKKDNLN